MTFDDIDYWVALLGTSAIASGCFVYDAENRLTEVRVGEPNAPCGRLRLAIWYDALGRRIDREERILYPLARSLDDQATGPIARAG